MSHLVSSRRLPLILGLLLTGLFTSTPAWAKGSLAPFNGTGTGFYVLSQGGAFITSGNASPKVTASRKKAKFKLSSVAGSPPLQTITLKNGRAALDHLLPGIDGFQGSASGTYKLVGGKVRATLSFPTESNGGGTVFIEIERTSFNTVLRISIELVFRNGAKSVVLTYFAT